VPHAALFVLPEPPASESESLPTVEVEEAPGGPIALGATRLSRACARVVLGGYSLSTKIEKASETLAFKLEARGIL
jgi:hypothetical protein